MTHIPQGSANTWHLLHLSLGSWVQGGGFWTITQIETRERAAGSRWVVHRRSPSFPWKELEPAPPSPGCSAPTTD